jgi:HAMP domain-containing protein
MPFHNGAFVSIGYIAVPYFLSEQIRQTEVRELLGRLIPTYLIALLLSLIFSYWATRRMTAPISLLADKMRHFAIGAKNNHIDYPYHDELGALVERYNQMVDRVEESAEKLANAEKDLVEKYEGLRDYIMSYGIKNRVSIPGDTFSAHRERYVFITITGKKLKVNYALDPKDYENGTIPVETNNSKKFEDLPLTFKIRSDLSYRRALKLVDDVMAKKGVTKNS